MASGTGHVGPRGSSISVAYLLKTDGTGNKLWEKAFAGKDYISCTRQTTDGGYIITGAIELPGATKGQAYAYLLKTDSQGRLRWQRNFEGSPMYEGDWVEQTSDGGYIVTGYPSPKSGLYLLKTDAKGNEVWGKGFVPPGSDWSRGNCVSQTKDGGYIVVGGSTPTGSKEAEEMYLVKTGPKGNKLWEKTFSGKGAAEGKSVQETTNGGYILAGSTYSGGSKKRYDEAYIVKTDRKGNVVWTKTFPGRAEAVQQTADGGYIVAVNRFTEKPSQIQTVLIKLKPVSSRSHR